MQVTRISSGVETPIQKKNRKVQKDAPKAKKIETKSASLRETPQWVTVNFIMTAMIGIGDDVEMRDAKFVLASRIDRDATRAQALQSFVQSLEDLRIDGDDGTLIPSKSLMAFFDVVFEQVGWSLEGDIEAIQSDGTLVMESSLPRLWEFVVDQEVDELALNMDLSHFNAFFATIPCGPMTKSAGKC